MIPGFNRIQRYVLAECVGSLAIVLGVVLAAIAIVDVVEQIRSIGTRADISALTAIKLTALRVPMLVEQTLPFTILAATMMAFTRLSRRAELPVIRASGVSAWRFTAPVMVLASALGVFAMTALNPAASRLNEIFVDERTRIMGGETPASTAGRPTIWLRDGDEQRRLIVRAARATGNGAMLEDVIMIEQARTRADGSEFFAFLRRIDARSATLADGAWRLEAARENTAGGEFRQHERLRIPTELAPDTLIERYAAPETIGFWRLPDFIRQTAEAGLDASRYRMRWHALLAAPAMFAAMAMIGALACLRLARLGGTTRLVALGVGTAGALFFASQLTSSLGSSGALPPSAAAWTPPLFSIFAVLALLAFREDG